MKMSGRFVQSMIIVCALVIKDEETSNHFKDISDDMNETYE